MARNDRARMSLLAATVGAFAISAHHGSMPPIKLNDPGFWPNSGRDAFKNISDSHARKKIKRKKR